MSKRLPQLAGIKIASNATRLYLVEVPFLTSHIAHLKASAPFLYVQTLQSQ